MSLSSSHTASAASSRPPSSQCLFQSDPDELSPVAIYRHINEGIALANVQALLQDSTLQSLQIMSELLSVPIRTLHTQSGDKSSRNLTPGQSATIYQYAKLLELAATIFGSRPSAEQWLCRPCRHLEHTVPMTMIDNAIGVQAVADYLERVRNGVYQ